MFNKLIYYFLFYPIYKLRLGSIGKRTKLIKPFITGYRRIFLGDNVFIRQYGWLAAEPITGDTSCSLYVGDGTYIGRFCHIYASSRIEIGKKVLIADKVYISDNVHGYRNVEVPIIDQEIIQKPCVVIGDGAWLGENVCIIGAKIGKNAVIGANSVVTRDVPDYCVAIGAPAFIIKRYDFNEKRWVETDRDGRIIR